LTTLASNMTRHLVEDIERLRRHLGIDRWMVFGVSWGSTLALAYSETYPDRVEAIVLGAVTMTRPSEIDWLYRGVGVLLPGPWEEFRRGSGIADPGADLVAAYRRLLEDPDPEVRYRAALNWCRWEDAVVSGGTPATPNPRYDDPEFRMAFARIVTHYFAHHAWLSDGQLIANAPTLDGIPGVLVHGSSDLSAQSTTAEELAATWSTSELHLIEDAGHSSANPLIANVLIEAFDNLGRTAQPDHP
jgi:proline iminopeptidase